MGSLLGVKETRIFVPRGLSEGIIGGIRGEGAVVVEVQGDYDECVRVAHQWGDEAEGGMLIEGTAFEGYVDIPRV
jgi:diaminopropionate ammonia-lyase